MTPQPPRRLPLAAPLESVTNPHGGQDVPVLRLARIDLTTRAVAVLSVKLPRGGGMDLYTGMSTAW